ncbi:hypothetical protein M0638_04160 [Roseomonas sp. NAR14]|uniref:Homeodomain-like domain-containing protein n=1 Tax=Roseomonas acroporae TaxID=2937791 RepID=A0A9X1Y3P4_9PROT|nr:hypothetical protein [Roseomonas acroporae]MCK8783574.1 hypothetical protein [Roseomonas acroporae]
MALDLGRLRKIWALTESPHPGEAMAALERARALLAQHGHTLRDIPVLLGAGERTAFAAGTPEPRPQARPAGPPDPDEARRRQAEAYRAAVIARYGDEESALAPTPAEAAVEAAAAPFKRRVAKTYHNGTFQTDSLDGWTYRLDGPAPPRVVAAVKAALPLPRTIAEARAEHDAWAERDRELAALYRSEGDTALSLACELRRDIVGEMLWTGLRAASLADAIARQRALVEDGTHRPEVARAVLADLEALAGESGPARTATARREAVLRLLDDPETAALADREIARRVGVSPQTVGNLRRRR